MLPSARSSEGKTSLWRLFLDFEEVEVKCGSSLVLLFFPKALKLGGRLGSRSDFGVCPAVWLPGNGNLVSSFLMFPAVGEGGSQWLQVLNQEVSTRMSL